MSYDIWLLLSAQRFIKFGLKLKNHYDMNKIDVCVCFSSEFVSFKRDGNEYSLRKPKRKKNNTKPKQQPKTV